MLELRPIDYAELDVKLSSLLKIVAVIFLAGMLYAKVLSLERDMESHQRTAEAKIAELEALERSNAVTIEKLESLRFAIGRIENKVDRLYEKHTK